jgi:dihydrofolate reductase
MNQAVRKLIADSIISLDGFFTSSANEIDSWFDFDEDEWQWSIDINREVGAILLGRVTYLEFSQFWPKAIPKTKPGQVIARQLNELPKIVFSRSLREGTWGPVEMVREDPGAAVARLKREPGKDLVVVGSGTLVSALLRGGLIDDFFIRVRPIILGAGRPLFVDPDTRHPLNLVSAKAFKSGVVGLHYRPAPTIRNTS